MRIRLLLTAAVLMAATPALAQEDDESLATRYTRGKRTLKRGSVKQLRGHKISIAGHKQMTVGEVADRISRGDRGAFPILDDEGHCLGMVSRHDLLSEDLPRDALVTDIVPSDVVSIGPNHLGYAIVVLAALLVLRKRLDRD